MTKTSRLILLLSLLALAGDRLNMVTGSSNEEASDDDSVGYGEDQVADNLFRSPSSAVQPINFSLASIAGANVSQTEENGQEHEGEAMEEENDQEEEEEEVEEEEEEEEGEEMEDNPEHGNGGQHAPLGQIDPIILANSIAGDIIAGEHPEYNDGQLALISEEMFLFMMESEHGAKVMGQNAHIFLTRGADFFDINSIHPKFFEFFDFTKLVKIESFTHVINQYILKAINFQTSRGTFNLQYFVQILEKLDYDVSMHIDQILISPHLYQMDQMAHPDVYLGRSLGFNVADQLGVCDLYIWSISTQMTLLALEKLSHFENKAYNTLINVKDLLSEAFRISDQYGVPMRGFNLNYFKQDFFSHPSVRNSFESIEAFAAHFHFSDFFSLYYNDLSTEKKIIYRLILYVGIFNPELISSEIDFNAQFCYAICTLKLQPYITNSERFFIENFLIPKLSMTAVKLILTEYPGSFVAINLLKSLSTSPKLFSELIASAPKVEDRLLWLQVQENRFKHRLDLKNEEFYKTAQASNPALSSSGSASANSHDESAKVIGKKRSIDDEPVKSHTFSEHFLSENQLKQLNHMSKLNVPERVPSRKDVIIPRINDAFFTEYHNFMMQRLDNADFGEIDWNMFLNEKTTEEKAVYAEHMKQLDRFVAVTFRALYFTFKSPLTNIKFIYEGGETFGDGPRLESLRNLALALLLPRYKVFFYNHRLAGFVPYPLLHPEIMGALGFLCSWLSHRELPISFNLADKYIQFLFYEENPGQSMQDLVRSLYSPLFQMMDGLASPIMNPLDSFPSFFKTHKPLSFVESDQSEPFDLFSPYEICRSPYLSLESLIDPSLKDLLDECIVVPKNRYGEESKEEDSNCMIESKEDEAFQSYYEEKEAYLKARARLDEQLEAKRNFVEMLKSTLSNDIIEHALMARFAFIRRFVLSYNSLAQPFINSQLYKELIKISNRELTFEELKDGFEFGSESYEIKVFDEVQKVQITAKEALLAILSTFSNDQLKDFYYFCTGTPILPIRGVKSRPISVVCDNLALFSTSHTCFRKFEFHVQPTLRANFGGVRMCILNPIIHDLNDTQIQAQSKTSEHRNLMAQAFLDVADAVSEPALEMDTVEPETMKKASEVVDLVSSDDGGGADEDILSVHPVGNEAEDGFEEDDQN